MRLRSSKSKRPANHIEGRGPQGSEGREARGCCEVGGKDHRKMGEREIGLRAKLAYEAEPASSGELLAHLPISTLPPGPATSLNPTGWVSPFVRCQHFGTGSENTGRSRTRVIGFQWYVLPQEGLRTPGSEGDNVRESGASPMPPSLLAASLGWCRNERTKT